MPEVRNSPGVFLQSATLTDLHASRANNTEYQNDSSYWRLVHMSGVNDASPTVVYAKSTTPCNEILLEDSVTVGWWVSYTFLVPPGWYYKVDHFGGGILTWWES